MILVEMEQKISSEDDDNGGNVEQFLSFFSVNASSISHKANKSKLKNVFLSACTLETIALVRIKGGLYDARYFIFILSFQWKNILGNVGLTGVSEVNMGYFQRIVKV